MVELNVCIGTSCHLKGSYNVVQVFQQMIEAYALHDKVLLKTAFCTRQCARTGVAASVNGQNYGVDAEKAGLFFKTHVLPLIEQG